MKPENEERIEERLNDPDGAQEGSKQAGPTMSADILVEKLRSYSPNLTRKDEKKLRGAYAYAEEKHRGQMRKSGHPYFSHVYEVANQLLEMRMDAPTVCAGLLHDLMEDAGVTAKRITNRFGKRICFLVEAVTKVTIEERDQPNDSLDDQPDHTYEDRIAAIYNKLVSAMKKKDVRPVIVKLADRLHNMKTIQFLEPEQQKRIAKETLNIYAPMARMLGFHPICTELEDLAFKTLMPEKYREIADQVQEKRAEREAYQKKTAEKIQKQLTGIEDAEVVGRLKHLYSIYRKIEERGIPFKDIDDLIAFRILVNAVDDCYRAMGRLHHRWQIVQDRWEDHISVPKKNGYRSIHTTVRIDNKPTPVQIRTRKMELECNHGDAAHWKYKEGEPDRDKLDWLTDLVDQLQDIRNSREYIQTMGQELSGSNNKIVVFTPKGDKLHLPPGATPLDFAFYIHTEVGLTAFSAKVNGQTVSLDSKLSSGNTVEILTDPNSRPSANMIKFAKTARAKRIMQRWIDERNFKRNVSFGKQKIENELKKQLEELEKQHKDLSEAMTEASRENIERSIALLGRLLDPSEATMKAELGRAVKKLKAGSIDELLAEVGSRKKTAQYVVRIMVSPLAKLGLLRKTEGQTPTNPRKDKRPAKCCVPVPGDETVLFETVGGFDTIHMSDCPRIADAPDRVRPHTDWFPAEGFTHQTVIEVESSDRRWLVRDVTHAISENDVNIHEGQVQTEDSCTATHRWTIEVRDAEHLQSTLEAIRDVEGVQSAARYRQKT